MTGLHEGIMVERREEVRVNVNSARKWIAHVVGCECCLGVELKEKEKENGDDVEQRWGSHLLIGFDAVGEPRGSYLQPIFL
jgi:hypothetical protein